MLPPEVSQKFIPALATERPIVYQPVILGAAQVRFLDTKAKIDYVEDFVLAARFVTTACPSSGRSARKSMIAIRSRERALEGAEYAPLPADAAKPKCYTAWNKELVTWIYANRKLELHSSPASKECSQPGESEGAFRTRLQHVGREQRDTAIEKMRQKYASKVTTLQERLRRAEQAVTKEKEQRSASLLSVGADIFGVVFGRKRATTAIGSVSRTYRRFGRHRPSRRRTSKR